MSNRVIVVGAGPTGLMLASELALAGVPCTVLEKRAEAPNITRAFGVASRTLELLDARGMADEIIAKGNIVTNAGINVGVGIDLSLIPSRFAYMLIAPQSLTETTLEARCHELGVEIVRGTAVTAVEQDAEGVSLTVSDANGTHVERAAYVVGCDGAHSAIRKALDMPFVGKENKTPITLADVRLRDVPDDFVSAAVTGAGLRLVIPFGDGYHRLIIWDRENDTKPIDAPLDVEELRAASIRISGSDLGMHDPRWMSRFLSEQRQAAHYRVGRVLLAGDAAHTHSPIGAQGMNTGIGDAMNLGWKLASVMHGTAPGWLLDTYESERHPVGSMVLRVTDALTRAVLIKSDLVLKAVRGLMRIAFDVELIRKHPRALISGVGIHYAPRGDKPNKLAGRRAPDRDLGGERLYELLRDGTFVLVDGTPDGAAARAAAGWGDRVELRRTDGGAVMLVRPDAYVAWASDTAPSAAEVQHVLADWCGPRVDEDVVVAQR
ncbi:FAD-dependent monooxygenase [Pseudonocardia sp. TRM90224]|uniref:FAD-dependent monooxygenase n=1 Tax=Pseudonocardia sp. TRM90224 TaxID=2812678 RepID=UPI001E363495|nr:FAD-dependent monooxygenase [Pseudonocardia sp. TRM90224]